MVINIALGILLGFVFVLAAAAMLTILFFVIYKIVGKIRNFNFLKIPDDFKDIGMTEWVSSIHSDSEIGNNTDDERCANEDI